MIRVRYAPSPTGDPHIGNMRTALFNFLYARHLGGKFILRIEDSDQDRLIKGSDKRIIDSLKLLGLEFDEGPFYQSKNLPAYQDTAEELVEKNKAYYCFCSVERLEELRREQESRKEPTRYDQKCRYIPLPVSKQRMKEEEYVIRFAVPENVEVKFDDIIYGPISFHSSNIDDFVIIKSDLFPTYHLAAMVDDHSAEISHVIRADEWISSTPKHILLYRAFGWEPPLFAHLPIILGPDRTKLSKRHGAVSVLDLIDQGYLPEALINFMALLGWSDENGQELFTLSELSEKFSLDRVNKAQPIFDFQKLDWFNHQYLKKIPDYRYADYLNDYIERKKLKRPTGNLNALITVMRDRIRKASEIGESEWAFAFTDKLEYEKELLIPNDSNKEKTISALKFCVDKWSEAGEWKMDNIRQVLEGNELGLNNQELLWPIRVALSAQKKSPPIWDMALYLGKDKSIEYVKKALDKLV